MEQQEGRCWRIGQKSSVCIYHLLALSTSDVLMNNMAFEKQQLSSALFDKTENESKLQFMSPTELRH